MCVMYCTNKIEYRMHLYNVCRELTYILGTLNMVITPRACARVNAISLSVCCR